MKKMEAIIPPFRLFEAREALGRLKLLEFTVIEISCAEKKPLRTAIHRGVELGRDYRPALRLELVGSADDIKVASHAIAAVVRDINGWESDIIISDIHQLVDLDHPCLAEQGETKYRHLERRLQLELSARSALL